MDLNTYTDEQIAESCKANPDNYGYLISRYESYLINYLLKNFNLARSDAEDLTQEALNKAYLSLQRFDPAKKWKPWLFQIAINSAKTFKRKPQIRNIEDYKNILLVENKNPDESIFGRKMQAALQTLAPLHQKLLIMHCLQNFSIKEISVQEKIPFSAVKIGISRAKRNLILSYYLKIDLQ